MISARRPASWRLALGGLLAAGALGGCGETRGLVLGSTDAGGDDDGACSGCSVTVAFAGDAATPQHGGATGTESVETCPGGQAVIGYRGFASEPDAGIVLVVGIQAICGELAVGSDRVTTVASVTLPAHGGSDGVPWTQTCPPDAVVVGFAGRSGAALDRIAVLCARWTVSSDGRSLSMDAPIALPAAGGDGGSAFDERCPPGRMARGSDLRSGDWVDAFGLVCASPALVVDAGSP